MHPSTALAAVLVDELVRGGVREAVLCPGSRSAPLAYALEEADRAGRLRLPVPAALAVWYLPIRATWRNLELMRKLHH